MVFVIWRDLYGCESLTPELTGAGGPIGPQGTNIGHQNREAMANVGVRVERFVRLGRVGRVCQVRSICVRFECPQKSSKRRMVRSRITLNKLTMDDLHLTFDRPDAKNKIVDTACCHFWIKSYFQNGV
jgi:hypothetical protein